MSKREKSIEKDRKKIRILCWKAEIINLLTGILGNLFNPLLLRMFSEFLF